MRTHSNGIPTSPPKSLRIRSRGPPQAILDRIAQIEIPDCSCRRAPLPCYCRTFRETGECDCPPFLPPPCPHVLTLNHNLTIAEWTEFLAGSLPDEYGERVKVGDMRLAFTRRARVQVLGTRRGEAQSLWNSADVFLGEWDEVACLWGFSPNGTHPQRAVVGKVRPEKPTATADHCPTSAMFRIALEAWMADNRLPIKPIPELDAKAPGPTILPFAGGAA